MPLVAVQCTRKDKPLLSTGTTLRPSSTSDRANNDSPRTIDECVQSVFESHNPPAITVHRIHRILLTYFISSDSDRDCALRLGLNGRGGSSSVRC